MAAMAIMVIFQKISGKSWKIMGKMVSVKSFHGFLEDLAFPTFLRLVSIFCNLSNSYIVRSVGFTLLLLGICRSPRV